MTGEANKGLKVALVQLDADDKLWNVKHVTALLEKAGDDVELVVFPEMMPFKWPENGISEIVTLAEAKRLLQEIKHSVPVILGGYVKEADNSKLPFNRSFLLHDGEILGEYDKQTPFCEEIISEKGITAFQFGNSGCIPLICADAYQEQGPKFVELMEKINQVNKVNNFPIVVSSYGAVQDDEEGWRESLFTLANFCQVPVVMCGVSGQSKESFWDEDWGELRHYGGGGSAVFWPNKKTIHHGIKLPTPKTKNPVPCKLTTWRAQEHSPQLNVPAIFVIDLDSRELKIRSLV